MPNFQPAEFPTPEAAVTEPCPTWLPQDPNVPHRERERCAVKGPHLIHSNGLQERYRVEKVHDPKGKHRGCRYFVLDPQHDPLARIALAAYADAAARSVVNEGHFRRRVYRALAGDLRSWLAHIARTEKS